MGVTNGADKRAGEWKKQHNTGTGMHQGKVRVSRNSRCSGGVPSITHTNTPKGLEKGPTVVALKSVGFPVRSSQGGEERSICI